MDDIVIVLDELLYFAKKDVEFLRKRGTPADADALEEFYGFLKLLQDSWKDENPGRERPQAFFVRSYDPKPTMLRKPPFRRFRCEKFWLKDFVSDQTAAQASLGPKGEIRGTESLCLAPCPACANAKAIVVGARGLTHKDVFGEIWKLQLHTLCLPCKRIKEMPDHHMEDHL